MSRYSKEEGHRNLRAPRKKISEKEELVSKIAGQPIPSSYTKKEGFLAPSLFVIISGGEKREKYYFDFFGRHYRELVDLFSQDLEFSLLLKIIQVDRGLM